MSKAMKTVTAVALLAIVTATIFFVCSIMGYLTDSESRTNTFTVGKVTIELNEPNYEYNEENHFLAPGETITEDPRIKNTGSNPAYVFLEVTVPKENVYTYTLQNGHGIKQPKAVTELFSYSKGSDWYLMNTDTAGSETNIYRYVYGTSAACKKLAAGSETSPLFQTITYANVIEGQLKSESISLKAYAIQAADLTKEDTSNPSKVWNILTEQSK